MKKGILITVLIVVLLIVTLAFIGGYIYMQFNREPSIPANAFLKIDIEGNIADVDMSVIPKNLSFKDLWYHIKRAKIDNRIRGIILRISYANTGFAKLEDIGRLIKDFRKSGKKVVAFIEGGGIKECYIASFADKVYLFKGGSLFLKGLATEAMFLKKTLSLVGVQADFIHIGEYKTAANMFTEDSMTPAHRESLEKLMNDIYSSTLEIIAANRGLDTAAVKKIFEDSPITNKAYLDARLIDGIRYEDEIFNDFKSRDYEIVSFDIYKETSTPRPYEGNNRIAVIFASGEIYSGKSGSQSLLGNDIMGSDTIAEQLRYVRKNRSVKAVVLRVDSPGGSAIASDVIRREVELVVKEKPLVISMSDLAASGGYWLSMSSSKVMALPQTITGSIGVVGGKFVLKGLYDKIGVNKEIIKTTKNADMLSDYRLFEPEEKQQLTESMTNLYREFLQVVAKSRKMKIEDVDKIGRGRVWAACTAKKLNLVDEIGGLIASIDEAKKLAKIPASENVGIIIYPKKKTLFDVIMSFAGAKTQASNPVQTFEAQIAMYKRFFPAFIMPYKISFY